MMMNMMMIMMMMLNLMIRLIFAIQGRPYLEKMNSDKIEMLYWLQQERRTITLQKETAMIDRKGKTAELPPISTLTLL